MQIFVLFFLFIVFPLCGIQALQKGEIGMAIFFFIPITILICSLIVNYFIVIPHKKRQEAVRKKYNIPEIVRDEYGEVWDREFQKVIKNAIDTTTDPSKLSDLQNCQRVANQMIKDSSRYTLDRPFYKINNAFRLTGCHFTITDSEGKTIAKIV
ncbi:hypothetical protein [Xylanibacter brevis]|uniref:hypothetical protein n=1 Tax=Xylanibacter brevis TaxID=83231 RepID=UPI000488F87D|nr:hypothetical protein [Xylanibacter brevis]